MSDISISKLKFLAADYRRIRENPSFSLNATVNFSATTNSTSLKFIGNTQRFDTGIS